MGPRLARAASEWELVAAESGISVYRRAVEDRELPIMRATATFAAKPYEILPVLHDVRYHREWMHRCIEAELLERKGPWDAVAYNRTAAPWPVADRDTVFRARLRVMEPGRVIESRFQNVPSLHLKPIPPNTVRLPTMRGFYKFTLQPDGATRVVYQLDTDPGGTIPTWLVIRTTREIPLITVRGLREQVMRRRDQYRDEQAELAALFGPIG
jgi:hypothetical protein